MPSTSGPSGLKLPISLPQERSVLLSEKYERLRQEVLNFLDSVNFDLDENALKTLGKLHKKASFQLHPDKNPQDYEYADQLFKEFMDFLEQEKRIKQGK